MYVTTFYSFKGGVGRTLALANVAAKLAQYGKRVAVIDFDLEAPGLDSYFPNTSSKDATPGLHGFVTEYINSGQPSKLDDRHYYEWQPEQNGSQGWGKLFIVPAGTSNTRGSTSFIDWKNLYEEKNGYHLFEHFRKQLEEKLNPDYVFIDSRTGFTDVCGICTRQLPDSVVLMYTLDDQNIVGIKEVKSSIVEAQENYKELGIDRLTDIIQVESNIPNLDDEEEILSELRTKANNIIPWDEDVLGEGKPLLIQRYQSLHLLKTPLFSIYRKNSRISKEFDALRVRVISNNFQDEKVVFQKASDFFKVLTNYRRSLSSTSRKWLNLFHVPSNKQKYFKSSLKREILLEDPADKISDSVRKFHSTNPDLLVCAAQVQIAKILEDDDSERRRRPSFYGKISKKNLYNPGVLKLVESFEFESTKTSKDRKWTTALEFLTSALLLSPSHAQANLVVSVLKVKNPEVVTTVCASLESNDSWKFALKSYDSQWLSTLQALIFCRVDWLSSNAELPKSDYINAFLGLFDRRNIWTENRPVTKSIFRYRSYFATIEEICSLAFFNKDWSKSVSNLITSEAKFLQPIIKSKLNRKPDSSVGGSDIILSLTSSCKFKTVLYLLGYHKEKTSKPKEVFEEQEALFKQDDTFKEHDFEWVQEPNENNNWPFSNEEYQDWTKIDSVPYLYNLGIACWGASGKPPTCLFNRLLQIANDDDYCESQWSVGSADNFDINTPNFWQCIAFAKAAVAICPKASLCRSLASINIIAGQFDKCSKKGILEILAPNYENEAFDETLSDVWSDLLKIYEDDVEETCFGLLNSSILLRVDSDSFVNTLKNMWDSAEDGLVPEMIQQRDDADSLSLT